MEEQKKVNIVFACAAGLTASPAMLASAERIIKQRRMEKAFNMIQHSIYTDKDTAELQKGMPKIDYVVTTQFFRDVVANSLADRGIKTTVIEIDHRNIFSGDKEVEKAIDYILKREKFRPKLIP